MKRRFMLDKKIPPYIKEGLVLLLDGRQGRKEGMWSDLINGYQVILYGSITHAGNGMKFNGGYGILDNKATSLITSNATLEVLVTRTGQTYYSDAIVAETITPLKVGIGPHYGDGTINTTCVQSYDTQYLATIPINSLTNVSVTYPDRALRVNTQLHSTHGSENYLTMNQSGFYIGGRNVGRGLEGQFKGTIHCIRLYNRKLSLNEIQHNYEIDKNLFL